MFFEFELGKCITKFLCKGKNRYSREKGVLLGGGGKRSLP
jgi:hypothetical protein